jgi:hypothetical protein
MESSPALVGFALERFAPAHSGAAPWEVVDAAPSRATLETVAEKLSKVYRKLRIKQLKPNLGGSRGTVIVFYRDGVRLQKGVDFKTTYGEADVL